jgi:hypothetical protein
MMNVKKSRQDVKALGKKRTPLFSIMKNKAQNAASKMVVPVTFSTEI